MFETTEMNNQSQDENFGMVDVENHRRECSGMRDQYVKEAIQNWYSAIKTLGNNWVNFSS